MADLEVEERAKQLRELHRQQMFIRVENAMLSEHLSRVVVARKSSLQLHLESMEKEQEEKEKAEAEEKAKAAAAAARAASEVAADQPARSGVRFSQVAAKPQEMVVLTLSPEEKLEIVDEECLFQRQYIEKIKVEQDRILDDLRAVLNAAKHRVAEFRKDRVDFNRDVLLLAQLNPVDKPYSEDILRFVVDKNRRKKNLRDNVLAKNARAKTERNSLLKQFGNKKDLEEILHVVDFDELKIVNGQLNARMRERVKEIRRLKRLIKSTLQVLENTLEMLSYAHDQGLRMKQSLTDRFPLVNSADGFIMAERVQRRKLHDAVIIALQNQDGPPQPTAMDYMKARNKAFGLRKEIKTWIGKVEIADLTRQELEKSLTLVHKDMASRGVTA
ncbi:hypothetical protein SELMODRAFT_427197 [Selaginella moellendorffii]|uniref:Cilia- and flagella-associated protein 263 n=1 Tax=Selaginella moellendorffii TaxID=88036 RepID=D8SYU3_SELML|nr:coiled-coil domain-containing protein 113 [Selaginella moellendorffii]EFJ10362.1 hypothetical protein SELMODRAFT_427197 [Selaginella moellendorffii]|eukprot:XP_002988566.1 coiled-coil domain-containing protein 113 [Selaginella moellendorffii]